MMTNKERLEQMIEQIRRLATLSEEIVERELYPVSYFSQAFDITNKIQEDLHQIELFQIELFEKQMKEHQAQVRATNQEMSAPEIAPTPTPAPPVQEKKIPPPTVSFEKSHLIDLKKVITLNDRFLFRRELFANDDNLMNQTISALNNEASYDDSIEYLKRHFDWNFDDEHVTDFLAVLKKRFS